MKYQQRIEGQPMGKPISLRLPMDADRVWRDSVETDPALFARWALLVMMLREGWTGTEDLAALPYRSGDDFQILTPQQAADHPEMIPGW
jgi:hypothetical protein